MTCAVPLWKSSVRDALGLEWTFLLIRSPICKVTPPPQMCLGKVINPNSIGVQKKINIYPLFRDSQLKVGWVYPQSKEFRLDPGTNFRWGVSLSDMLSRKMMVLTAKGGHVRGDFPILPTVSCGYWLPYREFFIHMSWGATLNGSR